MQTSIIFQNITLGISLAAPIGPANIAIMNQGFRRGFVAGFITGLGVITADLFYLLIIYFGISPFFNILVIQTFIWMFGSLTLLYLGQESIREFFERIDLDGKNVKQRGAFVEGFLVNVSNPMATVWWIGVYGAALSESIYLSASTIHALFQSMTIIFGLLVWVFMMAVLTHWGKRFLNEKSMSYIALVAGLLLIVFGLKFGYKGIISLKSFM